MDDRLAFVLVKLGHLAVEKDRDAYLRGLTQLCADAVEADRASLFLVDHARGELSTRVAQRLAGEIRLPIGRGLAGHSAATGETINVPDAYADPRFDPTTDRATGYRTQNVLVVPVWGGKGKVVAVIQALNQRQGSFERHEQMLLELIAENVAPTLEQIVLSRVA